VWFVAKGLPESLLLLLGVGEAAALLTELESTTS